MAYILLALLVGMAFGKVISKYGQAKLAGRFTLLGVMTLLFVMGAQIGSNPDVLLNLPRIGGQAVLLAVACVLGSIIVSLPLRQVKR